MIIGYSRVSTLDQNLELQNDALLNYGCEQIFNEKISSGKKRPELEKALNFLRENDTLVVWKLDRLGRSVRELLEIINDLNIRGISFVALQDKIDTSSAVGKFQLALFGALAEFERDIIRERTIAGLKSAKKRGRIGGRPTGTTPGVKKKIALLEKLRSDKSLSITEICKELNISRTTYYRLLREKLI